MTRAKGKAQASEEEVIESAIAVTEQENMDILQLLQDGQGELLSDYQLDVLETWDCDEVPTVMDPGILKAEEYDGNTWAGLAELIRKRQLRAGRDKEL